MMMLAEPAGASKRAVARASRGKPRVSAWRASVRRCSGGSQRAVEEGRIGEKDVERGGLEVGNVGTNDFDAVGPGRRGRIFARLLRSCRVNLDAHHARGAALGRHEAEQAAAGAHIEHAAARRQRRGGTKEHAVGAHLHGAAVVAHAELLEVEAVGARAHLRLGFGPISISSKPPERMSWCWKKSVLSFFPFKRTL